VRVADLRHSSYAQVAFWAALAAALLAGIGFALGAEAKELVSVAAAVAGITTVAVGLVLSQDAFKLLYDRDRKKFELRTAIEPGGTQITTTDSAVTQVAEDLRSAANVAGVTVDLNDLLPKLIRTAAGLAVALVLLGTLLLTGATFAAPDASPTASPSGSPSPAPTPS
jgi:hypothetical protein